ncbi:MAG: RDD family protein [Rhodospirillales bacterium 20-60-12]|nr:MAG: RDD family protein [Rhodospirillales bacterium 20-60-12]
MMTDDWLTRDVWPRRIVAFCIDVVLILLIDLAAVFSITIIGVVTLGFGFLLLHILPIMPFIYYTVWIAGSGASPGQAALGLAVRQDANLSRPSLAQALVWTLLLGLTFAFGLLPLLVVLVTKRRRTGHDILSGLVVVHKTALRQVAAP